MNMRMGTVVAGLLTFGLFSLPACKDSNINIGGTMEIKDSNDTPQDTIDVEDPRCDSPTLTVTLAGSSSGSIDVTLISVGAAELLGDDYVATLSAELSGTYSGSGSTVSVSGDATVSLDPSTGTDSCTKSSTDDCVLSVGGVSLTGTTTATLPTIGSGDTATLSGGSSTFSILVGTGCPGPLSALNDGYVDMDISIGVT